MGQNKLCVLTSQKQIYMEQWEKNSISRCKSDQQLQEMQTLTFYRPIYNLWTVWARGNPKIVQHRLSVGSPHFGMITQIPFESHVISPIQAAHTGPLMFAHRCPHQANTNVGMFAEVEVLLLDTVLPGVKTYGFTYFCLQSVCITRR